MNATNKTRVAKHAVHEGFHASGEASFFKSLSHRKRPSRTTLLPCARGDPSRFPVGDAKARRRCTPEASGAKTQDVQCMEGVTRPGETRMQTTI